MFAVIELSKEGLCELFRYGTRDKAQSVANHLMEIHCERTGDDDLRLEVMEVA